MNAGFPALIDRRTNVGRAWCDLWNEHGGVLLHDACGVREVQRTGAAWGVLWVQGGADFDLKSQAALVRAFAARDVLALSFEIYACALEIDPEFAPLRDHLVARWRDRCDREFSGLVIGPSVQAMKCPAVLAHAVRSIEGGKPVFLMKPEDEGW